MEAGVAGYGYIIKKCTFWWVLESVGRMGAECGPAGARAARPGKARFHYGRRLVTNTNLLTVLWYLIFIIQCSRWFAIYI